MKTGSLLAKTEYRPRDAFEQIQLDRFGERYAAYRRDFHRASNLEYEPDFPLYLMLEQTFKCNLRCPSCIQGYAAATQPFQAGRITDDLYDRLMEEARDSGLPSISMHVNDEPLLVKNLAERIAKARDAGVMDIIMTTNGNLMDKARAREVIEAGVTHILFSVDAATPETYAKVRPGGVFETVVAAVDHVNEIRAGSMFPLVRASFVKSVLNAHEEQAFHQFWGARVDYVEIQAFGGYKNVNGHLVVPGSRFLSAADFSCSMPFTRMAVRGNGDVIPCCSFQGYELVVGNVLRNSLRDIWMGEAMSALRQDARTRVYREQACRDCIASIVAED